MRLPAPPRSQRRVTPPFALVVPKARSDLTKIIRGTGDVKRLGRLAFRMDNIGSTETDKSSGPISGDLLHDYRHGVTFLDLAQPRMLPVDFDNMAGSALPLASLSAVCRAA
jgi:hypothetical protein